MKERPILFSGAMIRAILAGQKTQTRRAAKPVKHPDLGNLYDPGALVMEREPQHVIDRACPYGQPGDRLWVRETWAAHCDEDNLPPRDCSRDVRFYAVEHGRQHGLNPRIGKWRPSIHMPRWHSRILLEIVSVRVERLQSISEADAEAEGIDFLRHIQDNDETLTDRDVYQCLRDLTARDLYELLWDSINGEGSWAANPWVWAVEFKRVEEQPR